MRSTELQHTELAIENRLYPFFTFPSATTQLQKIHFTGANGFPAAVYGSFLQQFTSNYSVSAADCRGAFRQQSLPPKGFSLSDFATDLIHLIETVYSAPVIAMGHSFGAHVSLLAAIRRPDLFSKLVLIEPASLPNAPLDLVYRRLPRFLINKMVPMIKRTAERQKMWRSREGFVDKYRHHPTFKHLTDDAMQAYAQYGLYQRHDDQFELVFNPVWEAHIFSQMEYIWSNLNKSQVPCLFLKAENSNLYSKQKFEQENRRLGAHFIGLELPHTYHLMPLEHPAECTEAIMGWLTEISHGRDNRQSTS